MNTRSIYFNILYPSFVFLLLLPFSQGFSQANAGPDKTICAGSSVELGSDNYDPQNCYYWSASIPPDEIVSGQGTPKITVKPSTTKTYKLIVVLPNFEKQYPDEVKVTVLDIKIKRNNIDITNTPSNTTPNVVLVGQKIELNGVAEPSNVITSYEWIIPGKRVKNYTPTIFNAAPIQLENSDLINPNITFYWHEEINTDIIYKVSANDQLCQVSALFNVVIPTTTLTGIGTGQICFTDQWLAYDGSPFGLYFGLPTHFGITFQRTFIMPSGFSGGVTEYWQIINWTIRKKRDNNGNWDEYNKYNKLDTKLPYDNGSSTEDAPGLAATSVYDKILINDNFTMFLMFNANDNNSIWVPLRAINWEWSAEGTRNGDQWILENNSSQTRYPVSISTSKLPTWSGNIKNPIWWPY